MKIKYNTGNKNKGLSTTTCGAWGRWWMEIESPPSWSPTTPESSRDGWRWAGLLTRRRWGLGSSQPPLRATSPGGATATCCCRVWQWHVQQLAVDEVLQGSQEDEAPVRVGPLSRLTPWEPWQRPPGGEWGDWTGADEEKGRGVATKESGLEREGWPADMSRWESASLGVVEVAEGCLLIPSEDALPFLFSSLFSSSFFFFFLENLSLRMPAPRRITITRRFFGFFFSNGRAWVNFSGSKLKVESSRWSIKSFVFSYRGYM